MREKSFTDKIRHFNPSWFAAVMGTGVIGILIFNLPFGDQGIRTTIASVFLILNIILFLIFLLASIARYALFPQLWMLMIHEPIQSLFLGCFPMALATIISATVSISLVHTRLHSLIMFLWGLWWFDLALSYASCILLPYIMITRHRISWEHHNATWLLPVIPLIVAGSCGAVLTTALIESNPEKAKITVAASSVSLAMGLSLSMMIITTYLFRLFAHGFPAAGLVVSLLVPLGPCGQGGYALLLLGRHFNTLSSRLGIEEALYGKIAMALAAAGALTIWSIGSWLGIIAALGLVEATCTSKIHFRVNFWGMVFPLGVYSLLTMQLGHDLNLQFFRVCGTILSAITGLLWLGISSKTLYLAFDGTIFIAPCLDDKSQIRPWFNASSKSPKDEVGANGTSDMENAQEETAHTEGHGVVTNAQEVK
ncbi:Plasma membrane sulfite pump involved in sulfite metabolism [Serendipita sp. 396]|nr:Plasma membrane sulfite pump involved in sulfite metabolism [Serendipita sp. 396]KAG8840515.1 Plasma membrane sulfite pump involved in sulfite metabolism [Serendipita sp. 405]